METYYEFTSEELVVKCRLCCNADVVLYESDWDEGDCVEDYDVCMDCKKMERIRKLEAKGRVKCEHCGKHNKKREIIDVVFYEKILNMGNPVYDYFEGKKHIPQRGTLSNLYKHIPYKGCIDCYRLILSRGDKFYSKSIPNLEEYKIYNYICKHEEETYTTQRHENRYLGKTDI